LFKKYTKKEIRINAVDGKCLDKSLIDTRLLLDYQIPSYEKMISCMVDETARSKKFYSQYNLDPTSEK
jgi:dTDP-4-dehydrorhamnose reductase